jgi:predicted metal-dependent HD superfamily phosphohydrolase
MSLAEWWERTWSDLRLPRPGSQVLDELLGRYAEPHRAYHTAQHLEECREQFWRVRSLAADPGAVQLALWFHDAIYDTRSPHNEEESAAWAVQVLAGVGAPTPLQDSVCGMILATKHNAAPYSPDAALTVDIDLSILGALEPRFDEYEAQVRHEYSWVPEEAFWGARTKILHEFLARSRIYSTGSFYDRLEVPARANLQRSVARLSARSGWPSGVQTP